MNWPMRMHLSIALQMCKWKTDTKLSERNVILILSLQFKWCMNVKHFTWVFPTHLQTLLLNKTTLIYPSRVQVRDQVMEIWNGNSFVQFTSSEYEIFDFRKGYYIFHWKLKRRRVGETDCETRSEQSEVPDYRQVNICIVKNWILYVCCTVFPSYPTTCALFVKCSSFFCFFTIVLRRSQKNSWNKNDALYLLAEIVQNVVCYCIRQSNNIKIKHRNGWNYVDPINKRKENTRTHTCIYKHTTQHIKEMLSNECAKSDRNIL